MYCTVYVLYCMYCTVCTVLYVLYCMYCTVCTVLYVLYCMYCTVCTVTVMYCNCMLLYCNVTVLLPPPPPPCPSSPSLQKFRETCCQSEVQLLSEHCSQHAYLFIVPLPLSPSPWIWRSVRPCDGETECHTNSPSVCKPSRLYGVAYLSRPSKMWYLRILCKKKSLYSKWHCLQCHLLTKISTKHKVK